MKSQFFDDQYYHVYNRGVHKSPIFFSAENYHYCISLLKKYNQKYSVDIVAYCLMPNHYHLLLRQNEGGSIARFLQTTFNAYTQAINKQQCFHGTLFESRVQSIHVNTEKYLFRLVCYIHCNPVIAGMVSLPEEWEYSDYHKWAGLQERASLGKERFEAKGDYVTIVKAYLEERNDLKYEKYLFRE